MLHPLEIELRHRIHQDCYTTAYPWKPEDWAQYAQPGELLFKRNGRLSFYIHIPFCRNLCKFCEYTRCLIPSDAIQRNYLQIVHRDIRKFLLKYPDITLEGFDIGGGTPTALSPANFAYLMQIYKEVIHRVNLSDDFAPSIETSLTTITPEKIRMITEAGIPRLSIGIQSSLFSLVHTSCGWLHPEIQKVIETIKMIRYYGHFKINLDFMYGFKEFSWHDSFSSDRCAIDALNPDQVTIYELRTNQRHDVERDKPISRNAGYKIWYKLLSKRGYIGEYGWNSFSVDRYDLGLSSYIRHRMLEGGDYKGFGISAQSMFNGNVEYNIGKNHSNILELIPTGRLPKDVSFEATDHYELPDDEKFAKFICVSGYSGGFNWQIAKKKYMPNFFQRFGKLLDFLVDSGYVEITSDRIQLTEKGFDNYGPILSLFYHPQLLTVK